MQLGDAARAPSAFLQFCLRTPQACPQASASAADPGQVLDALSNLSEQTLWPSAASLRQMDRTLRRRVPDPAPRLTPSQAPKPPQAPHAPEALSDTAGPEGPAPGLIAIALTRATRNVMQQINSDVNRRIRPRDDQRTSGRAEVWSLPVTILGTRYGDCEDYALEKKRRLIEAGLPAAALMLATARTPQGQGHAVLVASTDVGDLVLDSLSPRVLPWEQVHYRWLLRQVAGDSLEWATVLMSPSGQGPG